MDADRFERAVYELVGYMVTSGRNLLDETPLYGPFRLVDAASRLVEILEQEDLASRRMSRLRQLIEQGKESVMGDTQAFQEFLDELVDALITGMDQGGDR
ncbi:MAG: DUF6092 family protein [Candidatus Bipolaricaulaceae bacterium]